METRAKSADPSPSRQSPSSAKRHPSCLPPHPLIRGQRSFCVDLAFDGARDARGTYVIWPDNLFDNGSLHDYAGPLTGNIGYDGQAIEPART